MLSQSEGERAVLCCYPDSKNIPLIFRLSFPWLMTAARPAFCATSWEFCRRAMPGAEGRIAFFAGPGALFDLHDLETGIDGLMRPRVPLSCGGWITIEGTEAMALAFMNSAGVNQMLGYTVNTWYGYAGWGCLDYFVEQPGRFTLAEAFFANEAALIHRLQVYFPELVEAAFDPLSKVAPVIKVSAAARAAGLTEQDGLGLLYDRDALAFYGDPAWAARLAPSRRAWEQHLSLTNGLWTFEIHPERGEQSFTAGDTNGSQRGGRPVVQLLAEPLDHIQIVEGQDLKPVITSRFILVPNPGKCDPAMTYRVTFRASKPISR